MPSPLSFALKKKDFNKSIYTSKRTIVWEHPNLSLVYGFIKNIKQPMDVGDDEGHHQVYLKQKYSCESEIYKDYLKNLNRSKGVATRYSLEPYTFGRIKPENWLSLSVFPRVTRHAYCQGNYYDVDIVNCQMAIIYEIASRSNEFKHIPMPLLKELRNQPKQFRSHIMAHHNVSKDIAKKLPIMLANGGEYENWIKKYCPDEINNKCKEVEKLQAELAPIRDTVYFTNQELKDEVLKAYPEKWNDEKTNKFCLSSAKRGVMALWYQSIERLLQEFAVKYTCQNFTIDVKQIVPCQDGFMVPTQFITEDQINELTTLLSTATKEKFDLDIEYILKPFDEARTDIDPISSEDIQTVYDQYKTLLTPKHLADRFLDNFGEYVLKSFDEIFVYSDERWHNETNKNSRFKMTKLISENLYENLMDDVKANQELLHDEKVKLIEIITNVTSKMVSVRDIQTHIISSLKQSEIEFDSKPNLVCFNNGVYDLLTEEFRDINYDDYLTLSVGYDYSPIVDAEKMAELEKIFRNIHANPEIHDYYLKVLASGLDALLYQKIFQYCGSGGNGKGLTASLMAAALGSYYVVPSNGLLKDLEKSNAASPDLYALRGKRYINWQEIEKDINVSVLRGLTGGSKKTARMLFGNNVSFEITATLCMEFNSDPNYVGNIRPADERRTVNIPFFSCFTSNPNKIGLKRNNVQYLEGNPLYERPSWVQSVKLTFMQMLLRVYKENKLKDQIGIDWGVLPKIIEESSLAFVSGQNLFKRMLYEKFEPSSDVTDIIPAIDLYNGIKHTPIWGDLSGQQRQKEYNRDRFYVFLKDEFDTTFTRQLMVYGLKYKQIEYEDDLEEEEDGIRLI